MVARALFALVLLGACATPNPVLGGGTRGELDGTLHVSTIDEETGAPIADAQIFVDGEDVGATDGNGRLSVPRDAYDRVEARASGFVTIAFVGAGAEVVTLPLRRAGTPDLATVRGEVAAFEDLTPPAGGVVRASIGLAAKVIAAAAPIATCESPGPCTFEAQVPAGRAQLFAQIDAVDPGPTAAPEDDIVTPLSFGLSDATTLGAGEVVEGLRVERFADTALATVDVATPDAGAGIDAVVGVPGIGLPNAALVFFAQPGQSSYRLPQPTGGLAAASYWAIAVGRNADGETLTVVREPRGMVSESLTPTSPVAPPTLRREVGEYVVEGLGAADLWQLSVGELRVVVFDGRDRVEAPDGEAAVVALEAPAAADGWNLSEVARLLTRRSTAQLP